MSTQLTSDRRPFTIKEKAAGFLKNPHCPWFLLKRVNLVKAELRDWFMAFISILPGEIGSKLRTHLIPFKKMGRNVTLLRGTLIEYPENLTIGDNTGINRHCYINASGGIEIGKRVLVGPAVIIYSQNHNYVDKNTYICDQGYTKAKVTIEDDVWLGIRSVILAGVRVREGTVVAAGAVVTKDTEAYSVVAGVPAIKVGQRL